MAYGNVNVDEMILRDHLAHERTVLANERTFLAYVGTAIALLAGGGTFPIVRRFTSRALSCWVWADLSLRSGRGGSSWWRGGFGRSTAGHRSEQDTAGHLMSERSEARATPWVFDTGGQMEPRRVDSCAVLCGCR